MKQGDRPEWSEPQWDDSSWERVELPSTWTGLGLFGYGGTVWFRRHFDLTPASMEDLSQGRWGLLVGPPAIAAAEFFVNGSRIPGQPISGHETHFRALRIPPAPLASGRLVVAVRLDRNAWLSDLLARNAGPFATPFEMGPLDFAQHRAHLEGADRLLGDLTSLVLAALLAAAGLVHLFLARRIRAHKLPAVMHLWFGFLCLAFALNTFAFSAWSLHVLGSYLWAIRLMGASVHLAAAASIGFFWEFTGRRLGSKTVLAVQGSHFALSAGILLWPDLQAVFATQVVRWLWIGVLLAGLAVMLMREALLKKDRQARLIALASLPLLAASAYEGILILSRTADPSHLPLTSWSFLLLAAATTVALSERYAAGLAQARDEKGALSVTVGKQGLQIEEANRRLQDELLSQSQIQMALKESEERYRDLVENINEMICTHDREGLLLGANRSAVKVLGYQDEAEVIGRNIREFVSPDTRHLFQDYLDAVLNKGFSEGLMKIVDSRGETHILEYSNSLRPEAGAGSASIIRGVSRVVTDRIRAEKEIRRLNQALEARVEEQAERLDEAQRQLMQAQKMEALGRLAGGIAHDFNNLLSIVSGSALIMSRKLGPDSGVQRYLEELSGVSERGRSLTTHLLAMGRRQVLPPTVFDLNELLGGLSNVLRRLLREDAELVFDLRGTCPVKADYAQIEQVVFNLAVNARDALPDGGTVVVSTSRSEPSQPDRRGKPAEARVCLRVADDGVGMLPDIQEKIFEPFFTTKEVDKGSGLGLSTVHGVVSQSGGSIRVESQPGRGTVFTIDLPLSSEPLTVRQEVEHDLSSYEGDETILAIEDNEKVLAIVVEILRQFGYEVIGASGPEEGLAAFRRSPQSIDLVLTDVIMPGMRGPEVARRLRLCRRDLKVVYLTGYSADEFLKVEGDDLIVVEKPVQASLLLPAIRRALGDAGGKDGSFPSDRRSQVV